MKITILSVFPPFRGGIAQFNEHMARAFRDAGHELQIIGFKRQYPSVFFPGKSQYSDHSSDFEVIRILDSIDPFSWKKTASIIDGFSPERIIVPYWSGFLSPALSGVLSRLKQYRRSGLLHNAIPHDAGYFQLKMSARFINECDDLIVLSSAVANDIHRVAGHHTLPVKQAFHPIYNHFPSALPRSEAHQKLGTKEDKYTLLFFGLIRPYKGLDVLLNAFNSLPDDYQLLIAGEAYESLDRYQRLLNSGAKSRVFFSESFIPDDEVGIWFSAADAVVLPYRSATQSGVTAAALNYYKPVIASDVGGIHEYIEHDLTGKLVPPSNTHELASAIIQWRQSAPSTAALQSAINEVRNRWNWPHFVELITS